MQPPAVARTATPIAILLALAVSWVALSAPSGQALAAKQTPCRDLVFTFESGPVVPGKVIVMDAVVLEDCTVHQTRRVVSASDAALAPVPTTSRHKAPGDPLTVGLVYQWLRDAAGLELK